MSRYAVLVEASKAKGQKELPGPVHDVRVLRRWLIAEAGGAWDDGEVEVLSNPSPSQVLDAVGRAGRADFAFVSFSGHGCMQEDWLGRLSQKVVVGTGEEMDFSQFRPASARCVLSCDACREVEKWTRLSESVVANMRYEKSLDPFTRRDYRAKFDQAVREAPAGAFTMYGCSIGEYAHEDALAGGYFSVGLVDGASAWWARAAATGVLTIDSAFDLARAAVRRARNDQNPMGGPESRSGNPFPFGICLKRGAAQAYRSW